jgi:IS30 family transposase
MPREIGEETKRDIIRFRAADYTKTDIGERLGSSRNTVRRHLRRFQEQFNREKVGIEIINKEGENR